MGNQQAYLFVFVCATVIGFCVWAVTDSMIKKDIVQQCQLVSKMIINKKVYDCYEIPARNEAWKVTP